MRFSTLIIVTLIIPLAALLAGCGDGVSSSADLGGVDTADATTTTTSPSTGTTNGDTSGGDTGPVLTCTPNLDRRIEAHELAPTLDTEVRYGVVSSESGVPVDVVGMADGDGRVWDFSGDREEQAWGLVARSLAGRWYADDMAPGGVGAGHFVLDFDRGGAVEAAYEHRSDGLWLLGLASAQADPAQGRTLLVYEEPVLLYPFPLEPGMEWVSVGEVVNGTAFGLPYGGRDTYVSRVDGVGRVDLPLLSFEPTLRVLTHVTVQPAIGAPTSRRQVSWLFECFGEVARATSLDGEMDDEFATASELRRIGF